MEFKVQNSPVSSSIYIYVPEKLIKYLQLTFISTKFLMLSYSELHELISSWAKVYITKITFLQFTSLNWMELIWWHVSLCDFGQGVFWTTWYNYYIVLKYLAYLCGRLNKNNMPPHDLLYFCLFVDFFISVN